MNTTQSVAVALASAVKSFKTFVSTDQEKANLWQDRIKFLIREFLPSGSGFDGDTSFDFQKSSENKLVFVTHFHHMNSEGFYTGWSHHEVIVTPSFIFGMDIVVKGINKNNIKEYIVDTFYEHMRKQIDTYTLYAQNNLVLI